ncbi:MAG TPA: mechanosensitive ion channel domain-containing protein [Gemmatimonadales bacterium]|nr:mechanosensitive ion channel domain-containing protein [Gemmatimonadales bacterium]
MTLRPLVLSLVAVLSPLGAQGRTAIPSAPDTVFVRDTTPRLPAGAPVVIDGDTVLRVYAPLGAMSPKERADAIAARISRLEAELKGSGDSITVLTEEGRTLVMLGERPLMTVLPGDADSAGVPAATLAGRYRDALAVAYTSSAINWRWEQILRGLLYTLLTTAVAFLLAWLIRQIVIRATRLLGLLRASRRLPSVKFQRLELLSAERIADLGTLILGVLRVVAWVLLGYFYIVLVLSYFPWTRELSSQILQYATAPLGAVARSIADYLPNIFFIAVIVVVTRWVLQLIKSVFGAIGNRTITLGGFEPDWAEPTYKLVRVLVMAFALVVLFPYLPGAHSDAFKGVSIFMGVLFSLGSTGAVANLTAGTLLTYTRSFQIGDRVRIGDVVGDVVGRTLLVTKLRTLTNVEVSIPNSQVMSGHVYNYTALAASQGVALQVTITIGYDVPWRRVHELLLAAAAATEGIEAAPAPFVLQTGLNDYYPAYELNAYTHDAARMRFTLSALHAAVQDHFATGGVEITSPAYMAMRNGDASTIPELPA